MKPEYSDGQTVFTSRLIPGTEAITGTEVQIVETYAARGEETRYLVRTFSGSKFHVYESDVSTHDPMLAFTEAQS